MNKMVPKHIKETVTLSNGIEMPWLGLGVYKVSEGSEIENAVHWALETGYRGIDTAALYHNEVGVGRAVQNSCVPREDIFVTTKVWNSDQGYERTLAAFQASLDKLQMDYVDLYLVHWPVAGLFKETYRAMETIYRNGQARAIGVSNFLSYQLEDLLQTAKVMPMVNQVEYHPYLQQRELVEFCQSQNIQLEAWRPLMNGNVVRVPELIAIGKKYGKTAAQVSIRWMLQNGVATIPKSSNSDRIKENADVFDFELTDEDMQIIAGLDRHQRYGQDPDNFYFDPEKYRS
jgi:diketogulonate reductase-like aldo/keto reductase